MENIIRIPASMCRSDAEVEDMRGTLPKDYDYEHLIQDEARVEVQGEGVLALLVRNCFSPKLVKESAKLLRTVHRDLSNRGSIIYKGSMMHAERKDGRLDPATAVPPSLLQLLQDQNARLGLTGPYSDFLGYMDRVRGKDFCRETAWSLKRPDIFEISRPLVKEVEYVNKHGLPTHWKRQRDFMKQVFQDFKYHNSMFSTVTINLNVQSAYHTDSGAFRGGMGNLVVLELGRDDSGILLMPRERVAFLVRPTDCLLMDVHHMHGNRPLTFGGKRLTAVLYARQNIHKCR